MRKLLNFTVLLFNLAIYSPQVQNESNLILEEKVKVTNFNLDQFILDLEDDNIKLEKTSEGLRFTNIETFDSSILTYETKRSSLKERDITFEINFFESQNRITLDVFDSEKTLLNTIEGLITKNEVGEADVIFAEGDETIYLSKLLNEGLVTRSWWSSFTNWIKGVANKVTEIVVSGLRFMTKVEVQIIGLDGGAMFLNMSKDSEGIYHASFDCWQQLVGYNNFYDFVFNLGTKMKAKKFPFFDENNDGLTDYILWAWKGDYWELGYGGELGIYRRLGNSNLWYVDKNLAIDMKMKVDYRTSIYSSWSTIIDWDPSKADGYTSKQWWITAFNPRYANSKLSDANLLQVTFSVKFVTKGYSSYFDSKLHSEFSKKHLYNSWSFNSGWFVYTL